MIYLDYAATTPVSENALHVFNEVSKSVYGNANSLHDIGSAAKDLLDYCKEEIAALLGARAKGIHFTSGGSESNVLAVKQLLKAVEKKGNHLITTAAEHPSLLDYFTYLEKEHGYSVTFLPVGKDGTVQLDAVKKALTEKTVLISIQHANPEIGTIQPIEKIGQLLQEKNILFHSDCVQTFGRLPINAAHFHLDSISVSSHKIYGPKGVGAVYINPALTGGRNEVRSGTANVPGIAAFAAAAQDIHEKMKPEQKRLQHLRNLLVEQLDRRSLPVEVFTSHNQLPNITGMRLDGIQGDYVMLECNRAGIAISTGSACSVGKQEPSNTMLALGIAQDQAKQFIRISTGKQTTETEIYRFAAVCEKIVASYQKKERVSL